MTQGQLQEPLSGALPGQLHGPIRGVLFDLDGTLIDTAPDFIRIIHQLCREAQVPAPSAEAIRAQVSEGARAMVRLIHPELTVDDPRLLAYREAFLKEYSLQLAVDSDVFPGLNPCLSWLETQHIPWGIVTNKPRWLAAALLNELGLTTRCAVLVCPDDVTHTKPDPEPMFLAASQLGLPAKDLIYVGDHPRDIDAGRAAGMQTVLAGFGYLPPNPLITLAEWGATVIIDEPEDLLPLIQSAIGTPHVVS